MSRKFKLILTVLLIVVLGFGLTACDSGGDSGGSDFLTESISVTVEDSESSAPLAEVSLSLMDADNNQLTQTTAADGTAIFENVKLKKDTEYVIIAKKSGYTDKEESFIAGQGADITIRMANYSAETNVSTAGEFTSALEDEEIEKIILADNITGDFIVNRDLIIDAAFFQITGNLTFGNGSQDLTIDFNNSVFEGTLTIDVAGGTVNLNDIEAETIVINSIGSHSLNINGNSRIFNLIVNSSGRVTGGDKVKKALIKSENFIFDIIPDEIDPDSDFEPEYEDYSNFSIQAAENQLKDEAFNLEITSAVNSEGEILAGTYNLSISSDAEGEVYSGTSEFNEGNTVQEISLTTAGFHLLTVEIEGVNREKTVEINVELPIPEKIEEINILTQPQSAEAGSTITAAVEVVDAEGQGIEGAAVTASLNYLTFSAGSTTVITDAEGRAEFNNLVINRARSNYRIGFKVLDNVSVESNSFSITPGNAYAGNSSIIYGSNFKAEAGIRTIETGIAGELQFNFRDQYNNPLAAGENVEFGSSALAPVAQLVAGLNGDFSLNQNMSSAVSDPAVLSAVTDNSGNVSLYFRAQAASEGKISATADGVSLETVTIKAEEESGLELSVIDVFEYHFMAKVTDLSTGEALLDLSKSEFTLYKNGAEYPIEDIFYEEMEPGYYTVYPTWSYSPILGYDVRVPEGNYTLNFNRDGLGSASIDFTHIIEETVEAPYATDVTINGTAKEHETLTVSYTYYSSDAGNPEAKTSPITKWYRSDSADGFYTEITGPNVVEGAYTLTADDIDRYIKVGITVQDTAGNSGVEVRSDPFGPINDFKELPEAVNLNVTGTAVVGETITGSYNYVPSDYGYPEYQSQYSWHRSDWSDHCDFVDTETLITFGFTTADSPDLSYVLQPEDIGKYIFLTITPKDKRTDGDGSGYTATSLGIVFGPVVDS